jgi:hypothetical protein
MLIGTAKAMNIVKIKIMANRTSKTKTVHNGDDQTLLVKRVFQLKRQEGKILSKAGSEENQPKHEGHRAEPCTG